MLKAKKKEQYLINKNYRFLKQAFKNIHKHDTMIILGDFNAKIGRENFNDDIAGKHTIHETTNDNGLRLCHTASELNM